MLLRISRPSSDHSASREQNTSLVFTLRFFLVLVPDNYCPADDENDCNDQDHPTDSMHWQPPSVSTEANYFVLPLTATPLAPRMSENLSMFSLIILAYSSRPFIDIPHHRTPTLYYDCLPPVNSVDSTTGTGKKGTSQADSAVHLASMRFTVANNHVILNT